MSMKSLSLYNKKHLVHIGSQNTSQTTHNISPQLIRPRIVVKRGRRVTVTYIIYNLFLQDCNHKVESDC
jgi:hypothetical protein